MRISRHFRPLLAAIGVIALAAPRVTAQSQRDHPDVTGVWVMDTTKFQKTDTVLIALTLTVSREGDTLRVASDVTDKRGQALVNSTSTARYALDGSPRPNAIAGGSAVVTSLLSWDGAILVLSSAGEISGRSIMTTERWTIDATGKTMSRYHVTAINGREVSQTLMFTRQQGPTPRAP